ncbi:MAG: response regulator [Nitrospinota bacterium]
MAGVILVIEDNPDNMALMEEILEDEAYSVLKATRAGEGIELLKSTGADAVLMDVSLPDMSGFDATRLIKSDPGLQKIPVIVLTAHAMDSHKRAAFKAGCDGFLTKPVDENLLRETLERCIGC